MSVPQPEMKQSVENSIVIPVFDWKNYPEQLQKILKKAVASENHTLDLSISEMYQVCSHKQLSIVEHYVKYEMAYIVSFLNAHPEITTLNISGHSMLSMGAKALASSKTLKTLDACYNQIDDDMAIDLAGSTSLTTLNISGNEITAKGATALAKSPNITDLNISSNPLRDGGAAAFKDSTALKTLKISRCGIGPDGAKLLANNTSITDLDISDNRIADGANAFANNKMLRHLNISGCHLFFHDAAKVFVDNTTLIMLNVSNNVVLRAAAHALLQHQNRTTVFKHQQFAFLMGGHRRAGDQSAILKFLMNFICDRKNTLEEIFGFLAPEPFQLIHSFEPEIMQAFHQLEETKVACETKETKEQRDSGVPHDAEDSMMQSPLAESLRALDVALSCRPPEIDVPSHNGMVVFRFDGGSSSSSSSATSTSSVPVEVQRGQIWNLEIR